jgi:predicted ArsR family transcriptional regulator
MTITEAKEQILKAHKTRAIMYYYLFDEMEKELGQETAIKIFKKATYRRGKDIQQEYINFINDDNFQALAEHFRISSPAEGELFHPKVEHTDNTSAILTMSSCPLVSAWIELGLPDEKIKLLCEVSAEIDFGTFESNNTNLTFTHQIANKDSVCRLVIKKK